MDGTPIQEVGVVFDGKQVWARIETVESETVESGTVESGTVESGTVEGGGA